MINIKDLNQDMKRVMSINGYAEKYRQLMKKVHSDPDVSAFLTANREVLSENDIDRSQAKLYEFYSEKSKIKNGKSAVADGYEPQLVLNDHTIEVVYRPSKQRLQKERARQFQKNIKTIAMPKGTKAASLNNFDYEGASAGRGIALNEALSFVEKEEKDPQKFQKGLYLYGPFGVGKTYLLAAIANRLGGDGIQVCMVHFPSFAVEMKNAIGNNQVEKKLDAIKKMPILMIDDIGADSMSSWIRDDILGVILEYRMANELPTFFSSNFSMKELENEHLTVNSQGDSEPLKAKRLMERIRFLSKPVEVMGKNRRNKGNQLD